MQDLILFTSSPSVESNHRDQVNVLQEQIKQTDAINLEQEVGINDAEDAEEDITSITVK